jgi:hypothetical protein
MVFQNRILTAVNAPPEVSPIPGGSRVSPLLQMHRLSKRPIPR